MNDAVKNRIAELLIDLPPSAPPPAAPGPMSPQWFQAICANMAYLFERWQATPPPREDLEKKRREQRLIEQHRRALEGLAQMMAAFDAGRQPHCDPVTAVCVAERVAEYVEIIRDEWINGSEEDFPSHLMDAFEREEMRLIKLRWVILEPMSKRLVDRKRVAAVADGRVRMTPYERRRWREVLDLLVDGVDGHSKLHDDMFDRQKEWDVDQPPGPLPQAATGADHC